MNLLSPSANDSAWIRIDLDRVDAMVGEELYHGSCSAGVVVAIGELADWLALRTLSQCYVTYSSQCCFICEFDLPDGSAAASDTAIRFTAEASLPLAVEDMAAIYFRRDAQVLFVAIRKLLLRQLQNLPVTIAMAIPESLLITSVAGAKSKKVVSFEIHNGVSKELITWQQTPVHWCVIKNDIGDEPRMFDQFKNTLGLGDGDCIDWNPEEGLALAESAFAGASRSLVRQLDFLADPTLDSDHVDAASQSFLRTSQIVFACCLVLICGLLYRRANLDNLTMELAEQRTELIKGVFDKTASRVSDRKVLSELKLRRGQQNRAREWLQLKPDAAGLFSDVLAVLGSLTDVNVVSVDSQPGQVEVVCQVQTKARTALLLKELIESGFATEVLVQRPADGLLSVQLLLTRTEQVVQ